MCVYTCHAMYMIVPEPEPHPAFAAEVHKICGHTKIMTDLQAGREGKGQTGAETVLQSL